MDECRSGNGTRCGTSECNLIVGKQSIGEGIAVAVPIAAAGQVLTIFVRTITVFFQHKADDFAEQANFKGIEMFLK